MNSIGSARGIQNWLGAFDSAAASVTRSTATATNPTAATSDSLIDGMASLNQSAAGVHAAIQVARTQDEMLGTLLDVQA